MSYKILIVDDEESIRYTYSAFLSEEGHQVITADNFKSGLESLDDDIDLVLLDLLLGRECGMDILREIKARGLLCPVIMITGSPEVETAAEAVRQGAYDYLCKPVVQRELLKVCRRALDYVAIAREKETFRLRMEGLFRCAREGIVITDSQMKIAEINAAARSMLDIDDSVCGVHFDQLETGNDCLGLSNFCDIIKARFEGELYQVRRQKANGQQQVLGMSASPLKTEDGVDYGYILILREEMPSTD